MKAGGDFFDVWGGISGVQSTLAALLTAGHHRRELPLGAVAALGAAAPAARFGLAATKGRVAVGLDADLALVDVGATRTLRREDLLDRHRQSPYVGQTFSGSAVRTVLRGETVAVEGGPVGPPRGRFVRPG
jgi:allantoinase